MDPPLSSVPHDDWFCLDCDPKIRDSEEFKFPESEVPVVRRKRLRLLKDEIDEANIVSDESRLKCPKLSNFSTDVSRGGDLGEVSEPLSKFSRTKPTQLPAHLSHSQTLNVPQLLATPFLQKRRLNSVPLRLRM